MFAKNVHCRKYLALKDLCFKVHGFCLEDPLNGVAAGGIGSGPQRSAVPTGGFALPPLEGKKVTVQTGDYRNDEDVFESDRAHALVADTWCLCRRMLSVDSP